MIHSAKAQYYSIRRYSNNWQYSVCWWNYVYIWKLINLRRTVYAMSIDNIRWVYIGRARLDCMPTLNSYIYTVPRWPRNFFLLVRKAQILKMLDSFRNRKSANFWDVPIRKSQIFKFVMINPHIAYPQISLLSKYANHKCANLQGKKQCFWSRSVLVCL